MALVPPTETDLREQIAAIIQSAALLDRPRVAEQSANFAEALRSADSPLRIADTNRILNALRRKRFFREMQSVAEALLQSGQDALVVRRQYAQALIDSGSLTAAKAVLRELIPDARSAPAEYAEARGLLGRALKQRYIASRSSARAQAALVEAIGWYYAAYQEHPDRNYWHAMNTVACIARARRDGVDPKIDVDERELAAEILDRIKPRLTQSVNAPDEWELATAVEACVALDDAATAKLMAREYVSHDAPDAFEFASTVRQLTEVWQLSETSEMGGAVLPILRAALLRRENGHVEMRPREVGASLELVHGTDGFHLLSWYADGLARARLVAQLRTRYGTAFGTGFLVRGEELTEELRGRWVLLTNAHVVSDVDDHWAAMPPVEAIATFEAAAKPGAAPPQCSVLKLRWVSGPEQLDTAVLELGTPIDGVTESDACSIAPHLPTAANKDRIYIIGHPAGRTLSYSLQDNLLLGCKSPKLHYRTPTEPGSSGSPLFDASWRLIGIHHAGDRNMPRLDGNGTYSANEGISIHAVREAIATSGLKHRA